jgi:hypothetical protein
MAAESAESDKGGAVFGAGRKQLLPVGLRSAAVVRLLRVAVPDPPWVRPVGETRGLDPWVIHRG